MKNESTQSPELGSLQPLMPQTNVKPPISEEERLAKLTDKQILGEVRRRYKGRKLGEMVGAAVDAALIICLFKAPISINDPYQLKRGKNKFFDLHKIKVK
jgi:hypothetical protein